MALCDAMPVGDTTIGAESPDLPSVAPAAHSCRSDSDRQCAGSDNQACNS